MGKDRITRLRIEGMRSIGRLDLALDGLRVLIGDNGTGKSTIVEACELLRLASQQDFMDRLNNDHSGLAGLGTNELSLGVRIEGDGPLLSYDFSVVRQGTHTVTASEMLHQERSVGPQSAAVITRTMAGATYCNSVTGATTSESRVHPAALLLPNMAAASSDPAILRTRAALANIEVHLPFDVLPEWALQVTNRRSDLRGTTTLAPAGRVSLLGRGLANAFFALRNDYSTEHWAETMEYIRLGLGPGFKDLKFNVDQGGGRLAIKVEFEGIADAVPSNFLADGTLAYLALVGIFRLGEDRILLAFDEPDLHLHPQLLMRVLGFFETMAKEHTVLLTTHSDRLLDGLSDPAEAVMVCALDEGMRTVIRRLDRQRLERWLERYRGLGEIRAEGHEASVLGDRDT